MIVINARFLTQVVTGVQRFAIELCNELPPTISGEKIIFLCPKSERINTINKDVTIIEFGKLKGNLWEQIELPYFLRKNNMPLLINLVGIGPIYYKNKITAIYDLAFKHHPEWFSFLFQKAYNLLIPKSLKNAKHIITDSEYVKNDIHNSYKIDLQKIKVIYAATAQKFKYLGLPKEKIVLTVSSIDPRKNLDRIIKAYTYLETDYKLFIVGKRHSSFAKFEIKKDLEEMGVVFTGYLTDEELINLYNRAQIFIYASLFEGFGIPPLEAQASGCCCIVSNTTSLPEVYQDSVLYCNPKSIESISDAMKELIVNNRKRIELQKLGFQNVNRFNWTISTKKLEEIIVNHNR